MCKCRDIFSGPRQYERFIAFEFVMHIRTDLQLSSREPRRDKHDPGVIYEQRFNREMMLSIEIADFVLNES